MNKRIVVPTDFSPLSKMGIKYAVAFAKQMGADLILLHVLPSLGPSLGTVTTSHLKHEMDVSTENELKKLVEEFETNGLSIKYQIAYGPSIEDVMETFSKTHTIDLIILASKGAAGLKRILLGSNTVGIINKCSTPVIVVPEQIMVTRTDTLVYASDLKNLTSEIQFIVPFAKALDATIKIIHVPLLKDLDQIQTEELADNLVKITGFQKIEFQIIRDEDVVATIEKYTDEIQGELLVMFTHQVSFLEQLFTKSVTREIAWHSKTPLLVVNNR